MLMTFITSKFTSVLKFLLNTWNILMLLLRNKDRSF